MNWLARLDVEAETARAEGIFDSYAWHKKLWDCFPNAPDAQRDFLTRIDPLEGAFRLWVLSGTKPVCPRWCSTDGFDLKQIAETFLSHRFYAFDVRANPVRALVQRDESGQPLLGENGRRKRGKRVPLVKSDELRAWLVRKGEVRCRDNETGDDVPGGFRIVEEKPLEISPMVESHFRKKGESAYHGGVQFRGTLEITDRARFIETYQSGIGSAKGFGFGLLLLAPINL
ncbi:type I-E CRISPR-associated protein Cas6/Cse3/CasE [Geobacter argillaceus]|uniref:CRISPR-associated protein, Cse3 family n=1 Tax=Geobacter argillaceus TaxID=345631 RepID=A0A562VKI8_9BACT|nr:type I-E CRISPR-associated protein Cas6/Cse3/CasE [Geobacter argillaceus]TWJ18390.1 CRISPR-associated protein, Cse3 family [Geobacter argillaceus]